MICSNQQNSGQVPVQNQKMDISSMSMDQIIHLKSQLAQSRKNLLEKVLSEVADLVNDQGCHYDAEVFSELNETIVFLLRRQSQQIRDVQMTLSSVIVRMLNDFTAQNLLYGMISQLVLNYSNQFNQFSAQLLVSMSNLKKEGARPQKRICHFEQVNSYVPNLRDRTIEIQEKLRSAKKPVQCSFNCNCLGGEQECLNMKNYIECDHYENCRNQVIRNKLFKKEQVDVLVLETFGFDRIGAKSLYLQIEEYDFYISDILINLNLLKGQLQQCLMKVIGECSCDVEVISKGKGLICCDDKGFYQGTIINGYFGEVYTPARWFDKQVVKNKRLQDGNQKIGLVNPQALFEMEQDLLFIDPSRYGNYVQHINYSCNPNCQLKQYDSNGQKYLVLITTRYVKYLEELTIPFPHGSQAQCYCGSIYCSKSEELHKYQLNYLDKNALLLKSGTIALNNQQLSQNLVIGVPNWAITWSTLMMEQEKDTNNIIASIDKVKYISSLTDIDEPPITLLKDTYPIFWNNVVVNHLKNPKVHQSIFSEIYTLLRRHNDLRQACQAMELILKMSKLVENHPQHAQLTRLTLLVISEICSTIKNSHFNHEALSTILYFMSFTHTYFQATKYPGQEIKAFEESEFEYVKQPKNKGKLTLTRIYTPQYLWGQLINWNKQELQNPQSSMAQDRRGILCYPSILLSFDNKHKTFPYQCRSKEQYIQYVAHKKDLQPDISGWSYQNHFNCYGSIFFEQVYSKNLVGDQFIADVCTLANQSFENKLTYWMEVEKKFDPYFDESMISNYYHIYIEQYLDFLDPQSSQTNLTSSVSQSKIYKYRDLRDPKKPKTLNTTELVLIIEGDTAYDGYL